MSRITKETKINKFQEEPTGVKNTTLVLQVDTMEKKKWFSSDKWERHSILDQ